MFVIASEGEKTEPTYFKCISYFNNEICFKIIKRLGSSPFQVLKQMKTSLSKLKLESSDEAWLVIDKDQWPENQLNELSQWTKEKANYFLALSNPNFEYWLLLHFEDGKGISSVQDCKRRLKKHLRNYNKVIHENQFKRIEILDAVKRAYKRDTHSSSPQHVFGSTTVYKLVEKIVK